MKNENLKNDFILISVVYSNKYNNEYILIAIVWQ